MHGESSTTLSFVVKEHRTSVAVWDVPSPVAVHASFAIKVGVKCSAGCELADQKVEVRDQAGSAVTSGIWEADPWPGTSGLFWSEVQLEAPDDEAYHRWMVRFPRPDLELAHEEASFAFGFKSAPPPEHTVTVEVTGKDTKSPIEKARVIVNPYRAQTDESRVARVAVPKGEYDLYAAMDGYATFKKTVEVTGDLTIEAELVPVLPNLG